MYKDSTRTISVDYIPDMKTVLLILWRHRKLIVMVTAASMLVGLAIVLSLPKSYKASSIVMLSHNKADNSLDTFKDMTATGEFDEMTMQTEVKMLNSPSLALQTIKATGLDKIEEFGNGDVHEAQQSFSKRLGVSPQGQSRIIEITFWAENPELAAQVTNAHVKSYLEAQTEFKKQQVEQLSHWFESKVTDMKAGVAKKAQAVQEFRALNNLPIGKDDKELIYQEISDVATQLVPIQVLKDETQAKLAAIEAADKTKNPDALPDVVTSRLIQDLKTQASIAAQNAQSLSAQYGKNHPKLVAARNQVSQINRAIATEIANIKSSLKNNAIAMEAQESSLQTRLSDLNKKADDMRVKLVTLNNLKVEQDASQRVLDNFMENYKRVQSQATLARPDAVVVSPAAVPINAAPPGKALLMIIVAVFSGSLALAVVFAIETMRGGVQNFEDVRRLSQKPLGILPQTLNPAHAILGPSGSSYKEAIKRIYMSGLLNNPARTILITSAMPKEGRTTFTVSLAWYLMSIGHKVAVIDTDFLKPTLSGMAGSPDAPGLADLLAGRATLDQVIATDKNGLSIIRAGRQALLSPDVLQSNKMSQLLTQMRQNFDYVLIDSSPLLARSEANIIANQADGILVIAEWMKTSQENIANMFKALEDSKTPVLGVVLNKVDIVKYKNISSGLDFLLPRTALAA